MNNINTNNPTPAPDSSGISLPSVGADQGQQGIGILQLANALSAGIAAQTVACAELNKYLNTYSNHMVNYAQNQIDLGKQMATVGEWINGIQWGVTALVVVATLGTAAVPALMAGGVAGTVSILPEIGASVANVAVQSVQTVGSLVQGGMS